MNKWDNYSGSTNSHYNCLPHHNQGCNRTFLLCCTNHCWNTSSHHNLQIYISTCEGWAMKKRKKKKKKRKEKKLFSETTYMSKWGSCNSLAGTSCNLKQHRIRSRTHIDRYYCNRHCRNTSSRCKLHKRINLKIKGVENEM